MRNLISKVKSEIMTKHNCYQIQLILKSLEETLNSTITYYLIIFMITVINPATMMLRMFMRSLLLMHRVSFGPMKFRQVEFRHLYCVLHSALYSTALQLRKVVSQCWSIIIRMCYNIFVL